MTAAVDLAEQLIRRGGHVHLMGVGGIGMAGIAFLLHQRGFRVSGCDLQENRQTEWLQKKGVEVMRGHAEAHVDASVDWLIRSTAVQDTHPEVQRAQVLGIPVSRRGEVLPALMRDRVCIAVSGTHGKTTTTAMIAQVLGCGYCVGGEVVGFDGVAQDGAVMVVEADESDGTVAGYCPDFSVITNIEFDHMEHHESETDFIRCFEKLIAQTKRTVFYCGDDPIAQRICKNDAHCEPFFYPDPPFSLPLPGRHNQWNAVATRAVARHWKSDAEIEKALGNIRPIRRRFETVLDRRGIRVVSDYAHHPTEVAALIQTAKSLQPRRLLAVFQPHRYTRTRALGADFPVSFAGLDALWLVPVYAASEPILSGGTTLDLMKHFPAEWGGRLRYAPSLAEAWMMVQAELRAGDLLLIIGAGDIEQFAEWTRDGIF